MDSVLEATPAKQRKIILDYNYCIICQQSQASKDVTRSISIEPIGSLLYSSRERDTFKDDKVFEFVGRTKNLTAQDIIYNTGFYHRECYKSFSNINELKRAEKRYNDALRNKGYVKRKPGRPSTTNENDEIENNMQTRSNTVPYNKNLCIICQKEGGTLHMVQVKTTGEHMFSVAKQLNDKSFSRRLNTIAAAEDATANDVLYHNLCWAKEKKEVERLNTPVREEDVIKTLSDIAFIHLLETNLNSLSGKVIDMNIVNSTYRNMLIRNGKSEESTSKNYKPYLKQLIEEHLPNTRFVKNKNANMPEQWCSTATQDYLFNTSMTECTNDNLAKIFTVAKLVREEV